MPQTRLFFTAARPAADALFAALEAEFEEEGLPIAMLELDEASAMQELSVYAQDDVPDTAARIAQVLRRAGRDEALGREALPEIDWVSRTLEGLPPVRAGKVLVHGSHDRHRRKIGDVAIEIEAGLAFGTGHHGTTAGCLEMMQKVLRRERPRLALDLGTGSGVLAIALARLAHIPVLATDIDPVAARVARQNVRLNGVASLVTVRTAPGFRDAVFSQHRVFELIVANILAQPLMRLAPDMAGQLAPGGSLLLSGILDRQRDAVVAAYAGQGFRHMRTLHREGWSTLHLKR